MRWHRSKMVQGHASMHHASTRPRSRRNLCTERSKEAPKLAFAMRQTILLIPISTRRIGKWKHYGDGFIRGGQLMLSPQPLRLSLALTVENQSSQLTDMSDSCGDHFSCSRTCRRWRRRQLSWTVPWGSKSNHVFASGASKKERKKERGNCGANALGRPQESSCQIPLDNRGGGLELD